MERSREKGDNYNQGRWRVLTPPENSTAPPLSAVTVREIGEVDEGLCSEQLRVIDMTAASG